jgi:hypothetical protein
MIKDWGNSFPQFKMTNYWRYIMEELLKEEFYDQFIKLFSDAKKNLLTAVNITMVYSYYEAGRMIVEQEQQGNERAEYGKYILKNCQKS